MAGKLSRRAFLRQVGLYSVGFAAVSEQQLESGRLAHKMGFSKYAKHLPVSRLVFESLACLLQLRQMQDDKKIDRVAIKNSDCNSPPI